MCVHVEGAVNECVCVGGAVDECMCVCVCGGEGGDVLGKF